MPQHPGKSTSGEAILCIVDTIGEDEVERTVNFVIGQFDTKYPESSWSETIAYFSELCEVLISVVRQYAAHKLASNSHKPNPAQFRHLDTHARYWSPDVDFARRACGFCNLAVLRTPILASEQSANSYSLRGRALVRKHGHYFQSGSVKHGH